MILFTGVKNRKGLMTEISTAIMVAIVATQETIGENEMITT